MTVLPMTLNGLPHVGGDPVLPIVGEANCDCCGGPSTLCCGLTEAQLVGSTATVTISGVTPGAPSCCDEFNGTWVCDFTFGCQWRHAPGPPGPLVAVDVGWDFQTNTLSVSFLRLQCDGADYEKIDANCAGGSVPFKSGPQNCTWPASVNVSFSFNP